MSWRDSLRTASFRGVPFYYETITSVVGRRTVVHEYAGRDNAEVEDLGKLAHEFMLDAFLIGPDYDVDRDSLIDALEIEGKGELVHPYWGNRSVAINGPIRIQESTREGGLVRISVNMIEVGEQQLPLRRWADTQAAVNTAAAAAAETSNEAYNDAFKKAGAIEETIDNARTAMDNASTTLRGVKGDINAAMNTVDSVIDSIDEMRDSLETLIRTPEQLVSTFSGIVQKTFATISSYDTTVQSLIDSDEVSELPYSDGPTSQHFRSDILMAAWRTLSEYDANSVVVLAAGSQGTIESTNLDAIIQYVRSISCIEAVRTASLITFTSFDAAFDVLDELTTELDALSNLATDDAEYSKLQELRAAISLHIQSTAADLPHIITYTMDQAMPALALAQEIYGDPNMAEDIIDRNLIRNPASVYGVIEILSND